MSGVTLDAGALIAFERGRRDVDLILDRAVATDVVDVSVVLCARMRRQAVVTSDPAISYGSTPGSGSLQSDPPRHSRSEVG